MSLTIFSPIGTLKGVGNKREEALKKSGVETVGDLLFRFPSSYRSGKVYPLSSERAGVFSYFHLTVDSTPVVLNLKGRGKTLRYIASDENGTSVQILHFHQPYLKNQIFSGQSLFFGGVLQEKNGVFYLFSPIREQNKPNEDALFPFIPPWEDFLPSRFLLFWIRFFLICFRRFQKPCQPIFWKNSL